MSVSTTIEKLSRSLPTDHAYCARTVCRDFQALESCLPINTENVDGLSRVSTFQFFAKELMAPLLTRDLANTLRGMPR